MAKEIRLKGLQGRHVRLRVMPADIQTSENDQFTTSTRLTYLLPGQDRLIIDYHPLDDKIALELYTQDPEKLRLLPGQRPASLIANTMSQLHAYQLQSLAYPRPLNQTQVKKYQLVEQTLAHLAPLLKRERDLSPQDYPAQEGLRQQVIRLIEDLRDENRLLALNPLVSEGSLGKMLYDIKQSVQHYQFNRQFAVTRADQQNYVADPEHQRTYLWRSRDHLDSSPKALEGCLQEIMRLYQLNPPHAWLNRPGNRIRQIEATATRLWHKLQSMADSLANPAAPDGKPKAALYETASEYAAEQINFHGLPQQAYPSLAAMVSGYFTSPSEPLSGRCIEEAWQKLSQDGPNGWAIVPSQSLLLIKKKGHLFQVRYFQQDGAYIPKPHSRDLWHLCEMPPQNLGRWQRWTQQASQLWQGTRSWYQYNQQRLGNYIQQALYQPYMAQVHEGHDRPEPTTPPPLDRETITRLLQEKNLLAPGESLESFIQRQLGSAPQLVQADHQPSPPPYINPAHWSVNMLRHFGGYFVDISERNPILGTMALAAYLYGGTAIIAPHTLSALLTKLHLKGLISTIESTKFIAQLMSHGKGAEALSAAITYWQAIIISGNLDTFAINSVEVLQDHPVELALALALALTLGFALCQGIPGLRKEMGLIPLPNYLATGAKAMAAGYDTIAHPGEDWLLGTGKWLLLSVARFGQILTAPLVEAAIYGIRQGLWSGIKKSSWLGFQTCRQAGVGIVDFSLLIPLFFMQEVAGLLIHVPFRGLTNMTSRLLAIAGSLQEIGRGLLDLHHDCRRRHWLQGFRISPLYGFSPRRQSPAHASWRQQAMDRGFNLLRIPFDLAKNLLILPLSDLASLTLRLTLQVLTLGLSVLAAVLGLTLINFGVIWDNSTGQILRNLAAYLTKGANFIDHAAGSIKQWLVSEIEVMRRTLYQWAFADADRQVHAEQGDSATRMLRQLIAEREKEEVVPPVPSYGPLFGRATSTAPLSPSAPHLDPQPHP